MPKLDYHSTHPNMRAESGWSARNDDESDIPEVY